MTKAKKKGGGGRRGMGVKIGVKAHGDISFIGTCM